MLLEFLTLASELQETAQAAVVFFQQSSYRIKREPSELGYPETPTLVVSRKGTKIFVLVSGGINLARIELWCGYAKSESCDARVCVVLAPARDLTQDELSRLRAQRVGLCLFQNRNLSEILPSVDLTVP